MKGIFKNLFLNLRFFLTGGIVVLAFIIAYAFPLFLFPALILLIGLVAVLITDILLLFLQSGKIICIRTTPVLFSLGADNPVTIDIYNGMGIPLRMSLVDELPFQYQERKFNADIKLNNGERKKINFTLRPVQRGEYLFGNTNIFLRSVIGFAERRIIIPNEKQTKVYPSVVEMKQMELKAFPKASHYQGVKKIRRLGHSYEFEQIKNYVLGDDFRSINWKATGRKGSLMVNQYEDEKAQQVYCLIDKSRAMKMPFNNLSLMDYAINTTLAISNISLIKHDKAGLITFADKPHTTLKAERNRSQLKKILDSLYNEEEKNAEANFEALYLTIKNFIKGRSLIFLYTNFESHYAMERVLPILRKINKTHLLVVIFFENSEIKDFARSEVNDLEGIYYQTIAQKFLEEKLKIMAQLRQFGIQAIYTRPEDLSMNTVNKYLELKSRGLI
ncbi:MAG: DUF58 domain-containing protein [Cytophagaceae bacterium]